MSTSISATNRMKSTGLLQLVVAAAAVTTIASCVQTRPARNAVFNDNQYLRKDFLTVPAGSTTPDPGWWLQGTVVSVSTPNPLGSASFGISPGINSGAIPVRFVITDDKLQMVDPREESPADPTSPQVTSAVVNAWPISNVDLEYYVNLDGEITNQYVTNQEAPWQQREWVQVDFDKNDMSDIAPMGESTWQLLNNCVDTANVSTTLVPNSFQVDEANNYMQWTVSVTLPLLWTGSTAAQTCAFAYGDLGIQAAALGKQSVTINLMYSLMRTKPLEQVTYKPLVIAEKDGIQHKYGFFPNITQNLDPVTGILAMQQQVMRFDPQKPIVWYFAQGFNPAYKHYFTDPGTGIADQTNKVLAAAGVPAQVVVREYDDPTDLPAGEGPRQYGDIRYSFLVWMSDQFSQDTFAGVTEFNTDYRTGEMMSATIAFNEFAFQDLYLQRVNDYLASIGAGGLNDAGQQDANLNSPNPWAATPTINDPTLATYCLPPSQPAPANSCPLIVAPLGGGTPQTYQCLQGSTLPIQSIVNAAVHNGTSTVFNKMQEYLGLPTAQNGNLGPQNFIAQPSVTNDQDFFNAYYALIPYTIYADPEANQYTIPEGGNGVFGPPASQAWTLLQQEVQFQQAQANLNAGSGTGWPYVGASGAPTLTEMATGMNNFRALQQAHQAYTYNKQLVNYQRHVAMDGLDSLSLENVADQIARTCGTDGNPGQWQTQAQWVNDLTQAYWGQVEFHEFGHSMGLEHNFMGNIDAPHYPSYPIGQATQAQCDANSLLVLDGGAGGCVPMMHTSSIMEYNAEIDRLSFTNPDWLPYDKGAIAWIFANNSADGTAPNGTACVATASTPCSISGQTSPTAPWNDPLGFDATGAEKNFLFCSEQHMKYTPLCRQGDMGRTPSEIVANALDSYEWQYLWRNQRQYHKFWDDSTYGNAPAALFTDLERFYSLWSFDWSTTELTETLHRIGITNPNPTAQSNQDYFQQLTNKFDAEISTANQMTVAYSLATVNQAENERPAATVYDPYYGDVTQQGIILDKVYSMQNFVGFWQATNYDPTQAAGAYLAYAYGGDTAFTSLTEWGMTQALGGVVNVFPYYQPLTVAIFAQDSHDPAYAAPSIRNWIGGWQFTREPDFLSFFQNLAVQHQYAGAGCQDTSGNQIACNCVTTATCNYDPRNIIDPAGENQLVGPDGRHYIWAYIQDRNQWVVAEQDTHIVTNVIVQNYNLDVIQAQDDGEFPGGAFGLELPIKYTADSFTQYN